MTEMVERRQRLSVDGDLQIEFGNRSARLHAAGNRIVVDAVDLRTAWIFLRRSLPYGVRAKLLRRLGTELAEIDLLLEFHVRGTPILVAGSNSGLLLGLFGIRHAQLFLLPLLAQVLLSSTGLPFRGND